MATKLNPDAIQDRSIASIKLQDGVIPSESTVSGWGFTKNAGTITGITMNGASKGTSGVVNLGTVITDVSGKADSSAAIGTLSLSINSSNYQITLSGTKVDGTTFTVSDVIDLPLESVVVSGSYDDTTQKVILTLKNGSTIDFSIADLIDGLQSEITSTNKLSADLIEDGTTNKTVTATEKQTWNSYANVQADWEQDTTTEDDYIENKPPIKAGTGTNSIIEGDLTNNTASGANSLAEGLLTTATGQASHAEGFLTFATAASAHAEGTNTFTCGQSAHAEGEKTSAFYDSHSEGKGSTTTSTFTISGSANAISYTTNTAHGLEVGDIVSYGTTLTGTRIARVTSVGSTTINVSETLSATALSNVNINIHKGIASGEASHSEGNETKALGDYSHTEGSKTVARNNYEHAEGFSNVSNKASATFGNAGNTIHSIGIGSNQIGKNAVEVMQNGDVYVYGVGDYDGTNPTTADTLQDAINNASMDLATPITYSELVTLKAGGNLVPGMQYRITDYTCTTTQANTQSAGNVFDIIVTADSSTELNENARAAHHTGDTYFANCDLDSWELKYCLENDTNRFAWADSSNGKGVIYYMKDEWNNIAPFDFKNMLFTRDTTWFSSHQSWATSVLGSVPSTNMNFYFLSWITQNNELQDLSIVGQTLTNNEGKYVGVYDNRIKETTAHLMGITEDATSIAFALPCTIIVNNYRYESGIFYGCYGNNLGSSCHNNTFGNRCYGNTFGNKCYGNTFGNTCYTNSLDYNCHDNSFGIQGANNIFRNNCYNNTFGNYCYQNSFGVGCHGNTFGNYFILNSLGNYCHENSFGNYISSLTLFEEVHYCNITGGANSIFVTNAQILNGTKGGSASSKRTITFESNKAYTQIAGMPNVGSVRIWKAEDTVTGPSTSTENNLAAFNGTTGKIIKDSGVALSSLYTKPSTGIPSTDLAQSVQTSLGLADTALQSYTETDPVFTASAAHGITSNDITNWNNKTSNVGTITGITMNGESKGTSGVVNLGTVITSETALSKGTTTGNGNAVTDISVSGHEITLTKGTTFLTQETDPVFGSSAAASITDSQINQWDAKVSANNGILTIQKNGTQVATFSANQTTNQTANIQVNELPSVSASDNGKILMVVNGAWSLVTPVSIYSGTSTPDSSLGDNGDLYIQTNS